MLTEQALRNVQPIIWVDPDQVRIERGVMDLGEREAVGDDRLAEALVFVGNDVRRIE